MMFVLKESACPGTYFQFLVVFFLGGVWCMDSCIASFAALHLKDHCAAVRATQSPGALRWFIALPSILGEHVSITDSPQENSSYFGACVCPGS